MENKRQIAPCGTRTAYNRHLRRGEKPCHSCEVANAEYGREYRARRRELIEAAEAGLTPPRDQRETVKAVLRDIDGLTHLSKNRVDMLKSNLLLITDAMQQVAMTMPERLAPLSKRQSELLAEIAALAEVDQEGAAADDQLTDGDGPALRIV